MASPPTARELQDAYMSGTGTPVQIDMQNYFSSYGRYGIAAVATEMSDFDTAPLGVLVNYTDVSVNNYITDIHADDYLDRALGYGVTSYNLTGKYVLVNGERRFQGALTPTNENYDFAPGNAGPQIESARYVAGFLLDPLGQGVKVPVQYTGTPLAVDLSAEDVANLPAMPAATSA